jgi:hypothetical protein
MANKTEAIFSSYAPTTGYLYSPGALQSLERAAVRLAVPAERLEASCEREAERCGDVAVAHLGRGVVAIKHGDAWKFRFPIAPSGALAD